MAVLKEYQLNRTGDNVAELLRKIERLGPVTHRTDGTMTAEDKIKLDSLGVRYGSTEYWNSQQGFIPNEGEIIIYSDYKTAEIDGETVNIPGIKIGSGNGYIQDLVFANDTGDVDISSHTSDTTIHTSAAEKAKWDSKLNIDDSNEVVQETLIFTRN